jgi:hypothetical protein
MLEASVQAAGFPWTVTLAAETVLGGTSKITCTRLAVEIVPVGGVVTIWTLEMGTIVRLEPSVVSS